VRLDALKIVLAGFLLGLSGCGGGGDDGGPQQIVTHIVSDPAYDGDIEQTGPASYTVTQGMSATVQNVLSGIDPTTQTEFRAFLDFPLGGPNGIPGDAIIDSAFLEFLVDDLVPSNGTVPIRVELVAFQPPTLLASDFDRSLQPALATVLVQGDVNNADIGHFVTVDVTTLMIEAQREGLADFQVRVMEDLGPPIYVLMSIDDATTSDRAQRAPLLTVTYR
jgi:hypothetical protein